MTQRERDEQRLNTKKRAKDRLREALAANPEPKPENKKRAPRAAPTYPSMPLSPAPGADPLARVLAWAKTQVPHVEAAAAAGPRVPGRKPSAVRPK